jgi:hypothetical protein
MTQHKTTASTDVDVEIFMVEVSRGRIEDANRKTAHLEGKEHHLKRRKGNQQ